MMERDERSDEIRADIEDTRARMSETLDQLGERLTPEHLASDVMHAVGDEVREATVGKVEEVARKIQREVPEHSLVTAAAIASAAIVFWLAWRWRSRN